MNNVDLQYRLNIVDQEILLKNENQSTMRSLINMINRYMEEDFTYYNRFIIPICGLGISLCLIFFGVFIFWVDRKNFIFYMTALILFVAAATIIRISIQLWVCNPSNFHYYFCWFMSIIITGFLTIVICSVLLDLLENNQPNTLL